MKSGTLKISTSGHHWSKSYPRVQRDGITLYALRSSEIASSTFREVEPHMQPIRHGTVRTSIIGQIYAPAREYSHFCQHIFALNKIPHFLYSYYERRDSS